jgi:hypothetical protein
LFGRNRRLIRERFFFIVCSLLLLLGLQSCMALVLERKENQPLVSLTGQIRGYNVNIERHFTREVWIYHLLGLPDFSLGTREGLAPDRLLDHVLSQETQENQGIIHLKIRHEHTAWTLIASAVTLGVLVPTAIIIEGDIVSLKDRRKDD